MDSNDFLLLSLAVTALALLISLFVNTSERAVIEESPISGWKKFTIRPEALAGGANPRPRVSSQAGGGELEVLSGNSGSFPIKIGHRKHGALLVIEKQLLSVKCMCVQSPSMCTSERKRNTPNCKVLWNEDTENI